jgi:hypothetical protein
MTFRKVCEYTGWDYSKAGDDRLNGADFIAHSGSGRIVCDQDDCAAAFLYVDMRRAGHTVRVAGAAANRIRTAMRDHPEADQLTTVEMENGNRFTLPSADLDLTSGYTSGSPVTSATMVDVRNLRARVECAVAADERVIGAEDERD